jgi:hypothetical protein
VSLLRILTVLKLGIRYDLSLSLSLSVSGLVRDGRRKQI